MSNTELFLSGFARRMFGGGNDAHLSLLRPRIVVFGVGGAGGNAVNNMIRAKLKGVEFVAANTDAQALRQSMARYRLQLGRDITEGLGAGSRPEVGRQAAEEGIDDILDYLDGAHMAFITAGMGGGTGTGAAPVIAKIAREEGILTVGVVTQPFKFEGPHRLRVADRGIAELRKSVDTLIVIPNQKLFKMADEDTTVVEAFAMADDVLLAGVSGLTDLMLWPGLVNLDFADIRTVISAMGEAMMGTGESTGEHRATEAAKKAISNPLLSDIPLSGARGVIVNVTGGKHVTLKEIDAAVSRVRDEVHTNANLIFGSSVDEALKETLRVSIFATGIGTDARTGRNANGVAKKANGAAKKANGAAKKTANAKARRPASAVAKAPARRTNGSAGAHTTA